MLIDRIIITDGRVNGDAIHQSGRNGPAHQQGILVGPVVAAPNVTHHLCLIPF